jgi:RimJ/RimL family protein N-acetyltransferase
MLHIRAAEPADWSGMWRIIEPVFRKGDTYAIERSITEGEARALWLELPQAAFVAAGDGGEILGTYYLKPNQAGGGAHVCNCGYIVGEQARGRGVASEMCVHSQGEAVARGFRAMQFNFVVSTNHTAIRLWKRHGFEVVGTLPGAFLHPDQGYVAALVMYKRLDAQEHTCSERS